MPDPVNAVFNVEILSPTQGATVGTIFQTSGTFDLNDQTYAAGYAYIEYDDENGNPIGTTTPVEITPTHVSGGQYTFTARLSFPSQGLSKTGPVYFRAVVQILIQVSPPPFPYRTHAVRVIPDEEVFRRTGAV